MKSVATIKLKLPVKEELVETLKQYSLSAQYAVDAGWDEGTCFKKEIHHLTYYPVREILDLPAQLVCSSRDKACETLKALRRVKNPTKPQFKEFLTVRYDARSFTFKKSFVTLASVKGRTKINIKIPEYYAQYIDWQPRNADLILDMKKRLFLHITFSRDFNINKSSNGLQVGVDVGINHVAVTSNRQFFRGTCIKQYRLKFKRLRARLQSKGTRSAQKRLKAISGRERRFKAYWNHIISKQIVNNCEAGTIVLENIKGIRANKSRKLNFWLHGWSFYQLQTFITYKSQRRGIRVIKISPYLTSQTCSKCGRLGSRSKNFFTCSHCNYSLNADLNASFNLAKHHSKADGVSATVTLPNIQSDEHKGTSYATACEPMDKSPRL